MPPHLAPDDEADRLACLDSYQIFGSPAEPSYDHLVELGATLFRVPTCLIAITGADAHWLKARKDFPFATLPRSGTFCCHALVGHAPFVVPDASQDPRFADHPLVTGPPGIRFYAGVPLVNAEGVRIGVFCILDSKPCQNFTDEALGLLSQLAAVVTARLDERRAMRKGNILGAFSDASTLAIVTTDAKGAVTFWNGAAERMFGHPRTAVVGRPIEIIMPERFRRAHAGGLHRMSTGGASRLAGKAVEVVGLHADGTEFPIEISISGWDGPCGKEFGAQIQDISARRAREAKLERLAHNDGVTGLPNRTVFEERVRQALGEGEAATVVTCEIDGVGAVDETFGQTVADALLQTVAIRLTACMPEGALLARLGHDGFALLLAGRNDPIAAGILAKSLLEAFAVPFHVDGYEIPLGLSLGIAVAPLHAGDAELLLGRADLAMQQARKEGPNAYRLFDAAMGNGLAAHRAFKDELRRAASAGEWELFYQPQVRLQDGAVIGVEALLRWNHPTRGLLAPGAFLLVLETHLAANAVGQWVLNEACRQLAEWRAGGCAIPRVAVNLFAAQFRNAGLEADVDAALARHGLAPADLELEITETIALHADDRGHAALDRLLQRGVEIAFDDFGTGFASLTSLKDLPATRLKIDKSFVQDLGESPNSSAIVSAVVSIGRSLGLNVIAEGVETELQRRQLMGLGCPSGQGYLFGKPVPARLVPGSVRVAA